MRTFILLIAGVIAGIAGTVLTYKSTDPIEQSVSIATPATNPEPSLPSPFAVTKPIEPEPTQVADGSAVASETHATPSNVAIADVKHYRELLSALQHVNNSDSKQIKVLLSGMPAQIYDKEFANALNTAIYQRWAELDIDEALIYAVEQFENSNGRYSQDPTRAVQILAAIQPEYVQEWIDNYASENPALLHAAYSGMASQDPEAFVREFLSTSNSEDLYATDQFGTIHSALMQWAEQDPQAAMAFLDSETGLSQMEGMKENLLFMWFERDPEAAIAEVEALLNDQTTSPDSRMMMSELYASHLAQTDPENALQWALTQDNPMLRENALMNIIYSWDHNDATSLMSFLDQLPAAERDSILPMAAPQIASNMARTDPTAALVWAEQLPETSRQNATMSVINEWIHTDPVSAMSWIRNQPDSAEYQGILIGAVSSIMYQDPSTASEIFSTLPEQQQNSLAESMVFMQAERDPDAAREWISQQTNPTVQEIGFIALDSLNPDIDAISLLDRIASLQSENRENLLMNAIGQRASTDMESIKQWVVATPLLRDEERAMLTEITSYQGYGPQYFPPGIPPGLQFYDRQ